MTPEETFEWLRERSSRLEAEEEKVRKLLDIAKRATAALRAAEVEGEKINADLMEFLMRERAREAMCSAGGEA